MEILNAAHIGQTPQQNRDRSNFAMPFYHRLNDHCAVFATSRT